MLWSLGSTIVARSLRLRVGTCLIESLGIGHIHSRQMLTDWGLITGLSHGIHLSLKLGSETVCTDALILLIALI